MSEDWCPTCGTRHRRKRDCPGELVATGPEREGFRVNVHTPLGIEGCGVLVAPCEDLWRARILTYPNILWTLPGGSATLKFVGRTAREAEREAIAYLREHIHERGYTMRDEVTVAPPPGERDECLDGLPRPPQPPAARFARFLPVRFGLTQVTELAGTGNLSCTGLFIITDRPEKKGTWLNMLIELEQDRIGLKGLVRWHNRVHRAGRSPGMGVQLETPPPSYLDYIRSLS
jgi:hypothetical protein